MHLVLDEGNNFIKAGLFKEGILLESHTFSTPYDTLLWTSQSSFEKATFTSVKKDSLFANEGFIRVTNESDFPIEIDYKTPESLGIDRLCAVIGAINEHANNKLIIDLGTCMTFEVLLQNKTYTGGLISPGLKMRFKAMNNYTDALPLIDNKSPIDIDLGKTGKSTVESMTAGVIMGMTEEINGHIKRFKQLYEINEVYLTGGDSLLFESYIKAPIFVDRNLVLKGVDRIAEHNANK